MSVKMGATSLGFGLSRDAESWAREAYLYVGKVNRRMFFIIVKSSSKLVHPRWLFGLSQKDSQASRSKTGDNPEPQRHAR